MFLRLMARGADELGKRRRLPPAVIWLSAITRLVKAVARLPVLIRLLHANETAPPWQHDFCMAIYLQVHPGSTDSAASRSESSLF
jgi:hypothetical protein